MRVGIICAGDSEVEPFLALMKKCQTSEKAMLKFYEGKINDVEVVTLFCGACKVNAAIAAQIIIDTYRVDCVINAGTAGGMDPKLEIFDTVIATEVAYHDVAPNILTEFHPWMKSVYFKMDQALLSLAEKAVEKLEIKDKIFWGRMVTGEAFIADEGREKINKEFSLLTVDMETASIAHVCYVNNIPFISIRSITDTATHSGSEHFEQNCEKAAIMAKDVTVALLAEIYDTCHNS